LDGSSHAWFQDDHRYDLLVILDDAASEIYYAQLVEGVDERGDDGAARSHRTERSFLCVVQRASWL